MCANYKVMPPQAIKSTPMPQQLQALEKDTHAPDIKIDWNHRENSLTCGNSWKQWKKYFKHMKAIATGSMLKTSGRTIIVTEDNLLAYKQDKMYNTQVSTVEYNCFAPYQLVSVIFKTK